MLSHSTSLANSVCDLYHEQNVVYPVKLRKNVFTTGEMDNIDHNPSSTTSKDSFHGREISLLQNIPNEDAGEKRDGISVQPGMDSKTLRELPEEYTNIHPAVLNTSKPIVPASNGPYRWDL